ncbi:uncharacterized mitochondrial protein AtMg00810-like [Setaria viridis]|uniref:uncharacterized mitochondrial protein AtMg00810-like n=1 Tax=Setaria viridis TaxID=4556 RepID=UPI00149331F7|nr:uncharacterized mitochondrial protein AtMg00810-like [Setaria viridis]
MGFEQSPHEVAVYRRGNGGNALLVGIYVDDLVIKGIKEEKMEAFKEEMTAYAKRVIELGGLTDCNPALTPTKDRLKLSRDSTAEEVDATQYWRLVGSLRYLTHTRSNLAFIVGNISRFMQQPTTEHLQAIKRILRYIAETLDYGLHYSRLSGSLGCSTISLARILKQWSLGWTASPLWLWRRIPSSTSEASISE